MARVRRELPADPLRPFDRMGRNRMLPRDMTRVEVAHDVSEALQRIALSIFTDMSNNNYSFREAITAVYLSGLQHGGELGREVAHEQGA